LPDRLRDLRAHLAQVEDVRYAAGLLGWDQQTMMPPRGGPTRAEALATLERICHEMFIGPDTERLLNAAHSELSGAGEESDDDDTSLVRVVRRDYEKARRVPGRLAADRARAASVGQEAWIRAREASDFSAFAPYLTRNLELAREYVDCFDGFDCAYDVLLDDYESGARSAAVSLLFDELKRELVPMIATLREHGDALDDSCLHASAPVDKQRALAAGVVSLMGFNHDGWRMDDAVHPFAAGFGSGDTRITTRWDGMFFPGGLYGAMHECGHGLYEDGIADELRRTPLGHGRSLGMHESQSRLWENMVGRGRPFCTVLAPRVAELFGGPLANLDPDTLYRAVNRVRPSFIRVEADEATYGLHIVLRFELEQELIEGRLAVADLPEAWNSRFMEYFGLEVPDDSHGVLQDVHWAAGLMGYFPTYALGNLIAGQLWARVHAGSPELDARIAAGDLVPLREWLRDNVHRHGAKFRTDELLHRVVEAPIEVAPFIRYLKAKLGDVYGVAL
jgi:carboxypeptidase Taq